MISMKGPLLIWFQVYHGIFWTTDPRRSFWNKELTGIEDVVSWFSNEWEHFPDNFLGHLHFCFNSLVTPSNFLMPPACFLYRWHQKKTSNRSKKVVLGASNDSFEVGSCKKIETDFLPKYDFPHKILTKITFFLKKVQPPSTSFRSGL